MPYRAPLLAAFVALVGSQPARAGDAPSEAVALARTIVSQPHAQRVALMLAQPPAQRLAVIQALTPEELCDVGSDAAKALGTYSARLVKEERIDGKMKPAQTLELVVRDDPNAIAARYVDGPAKGRRLLYNAQIRKDELRVREAGILGIAGALWIGLDSRLTRKDTNHRSTSLGLAPLVRLLRKDLDTAKPFGGFRGIAGRLGEQDRACLTFEAPAQASGLYAKTSHLCVDTSLLLPVEAEIHDAQGLLERYRWSDVKPNLAVDETTFSLEGNDL